MQQFERICKECFWDYAISPEEVQKIIVDGSYLDKKKLFFKILFNSTDRLTVCIPMKPARDSGRNLPPIWY
jgi:hypothetical protein